MLESEVVANVFWCSSRMDPRTTYWEYKCSSVDTALYTDAWGIKHNCGKKTDVYDKALLKSGGSQLILHRDPTLYTFANASQ